MKKLILLILCINVSLAMSSRSYAFSFTEGHFYATPNNRYDQGLHYVTEYDASGSIVDTLNLSSLNYSQELRGLAFGPDGLLYVTVAQEDITLPPVFDVLAIDSSGTVQKTYSHSSQHTWSNSCYGNIEFDNNGHFYIGGKTGIIRFDVDSPGSGSYFSGINYGVFGTKVLPNANMLVATNASLFELDASGNQIREIAAFNLFSANRGIEYDPQSNIIYISGFGYTGFPDGILMLDAITEERLNKTDFLNPGSLCLTADGRLISGRGIDLASGIFDTDLNYLDSFEGDGRPFITEYTVIPEPGTMLLLGSLATGLFSVASIKKGRNLK